MKNGALRWSILEEIKSVMYKSLKQAIKCTGIRAPHVRLTARARSTGRVNCHNGWVSGNVNNKYDSDCVNFSSMERLEEMLNGLRDLRSLFRIALFPGDEVGGGFDHAIFEDCCFLVLNYSSHVIHRLGLVIKLVFTPIARTYIDLVITRSVLAIWATCNFVELPQLLIN